MISFGYIQILDLVQIFCVYILKLVVAHIICSLQRIQLLILLLLIFSVNNEPQLFSLRKIKMK